tara:strand:- start:274 stop:549 length:276 start_codon:yes stop_codon:yes gene_type:complete
MHLHSQKDCGAVSRAIAKSVVMNSHGSPEGCEETAIHAMTDGVTPSDDHEKRRLAAFSNTFVNLPAGGVDLLDATFVECSSKRDHSEASMG